MKLRLSLSRFRNFLLKNERWGQALVKNLIWLALGQGMVRLVRMAVILSVVRVLGPMEYGRFALAYSFVTLFTGLLEGGVLIVASREFAADPSNEKLLPNVVAIKVITNSIAAALVLPGMFWVTTDPIVRKCTVALLAQQFIFELGSSIYAATRARGKMEYESTLSFLQNAILLVLTVAALHFSSSAFTVSLAQLAAAVLWLPLLSFVVWKSGYRFEGGVHWSAIVHIGTLTAPLLLGSIATAVYVNVDSILLGKFGNLIEVGWYNAAVKVVQGILLIPISLATIAVVPAFASLLGSQENNLVQRWNKWRAFLIVTGGYVAALLFASARPLVLSTFGAHFLPIVPIVRVMSVSIALMYVYTPYSQALIIYRKQTVLFACQAVAAVVSVTSNLITIPRYGMYGAAWTTVATQGVLLLLLASVAPRHAPNPFMGSRFGKVLLGCGVSAVIVIACALWGANPWFDCALATGLFGIVWISVSKRFTLVLSAAK